MNSDLDKQEKAITANLRPPLEQSRAVQDSTERSKDLKVHSCGSRQIVLNRDQASERVSRVVLSMLGAVSSPRAQEHAGTGRCLQLVVLPVETGRRHLNSLRAKTFDLFLAQLSHRKVEWGKR